MTNPGLPPALSKSSHDVAETRAKNLRRELDELLAEVDEALSADAAPVPPRGAARRRIGGPKLAA